MRAGRWIAHRLGDNLAPALFVALVGCLSLAYVGSARDQLLIALLAACAAAAAAAGICLEILRVDARLAAEEIAAAWPVGETVHSFARSGRSALLVMVHLDRRGRVLEAAAYDPDEYS